MSIAANEYLQGFKTLPLQQQLQLSQAINHYLMQYFSDFTLQVEQDEKANWQIFANENLAKAFGENEPQYLITDIETSI
jgi:hypothetical protein